MVTSHRASENFAHSCSLFAWRIVTRELAQTDVRCAARTIAEPSCGREEDARGRKPPGRGTGRHARHLPVAHPRCIAATGPPASSCAQCRRTPLAGERIHRLESGSVLCELCFARCRTSGGVAVRSDRVPASERPLSVGPMAA